MCKPCLYECDTMSKITDTERLNWIQHHICINLVNDDDGNYAMTSGGFQPVPQGGGKGFNETVTISHIIDPEQWKSTVREAIDYAMKKEL